MNPFRKIRPLFQKKKLEAEMAEEMRLHLELQTEQNIQAGMKADEARYAALRQFGNVASVQERAREARGWVRIELFGKNLRFAARALLRSPGFTVTALITLALCLGANLTIFAVVDAILVRSLPLPDANRLVTIINSYPKAGYDRGGSSIANYFERRHSIPAFTSVSLFSEDSVIVGDAGSPQRLPIARVTPDFFATLGMPLAQGRTFTDAALTYGPDGVVVITDEFWRTYFNAAPDVLGRTFLNDALPVTVIGVLPPGFRFLSARAEFFRPLSHAPEMRLPQSRHVSSAQMIARLAPGASLTLAQTQLDALETRLASDDPQKALWPSWGFRTIIRALHADHVREVRSVLLLVQVGAFFLLLIGLVNLANLLLVRASTRSKEMAVRQALGATRRHIAAQLLIEIVLLALVGGGLGLFLAMLGVRGVTLLGAEHLPLGATVSLDGRIGAIAFATILVGGGFLALPVLWLTLRARLAHGLQIQSHGGTASRLAQLLRHGFIVVQISLTFMLLTGSGLLGLSLKRLWETPVGFNTTNILSGQITLPWKYYPDGQKRAAFVERLLTGLRALPGVIHVAINNGLPFTGRVGGGIVAVEGSNLPPGETSHGNYRMGVTSDYWELMSIPLLQGRLLTQADEERTDNVCVVDQAFADRYWSGVDPIGRRLSYGDAFDEKNAATVVGVVGSAKQKSLMENSDFGAVYFPFSKFGTAFFYLTVRANQSVESLAPSIRKTILQLDPNLPIDDLRPMQSRIDDSLVARRTPAILAALFSGVALILAGVGTYGVLSYAVAQKHREIGVRMALGARPAQVGLHFMKLGLQLLALGTILGLIGAALAGKAMQSILFGVPAIHGPTLAITGGILALIAISACLIPVRRATKIDPMIVLRAE